MNLKSLAAEGGDARRIAGAAVAVWRAIDAALCPVIGQRGSTALYKRSLHLARAHYPWLETAYGGALEPGDFASLGTALAQQTPAQAATAQDALVQTFHDLLADLIGRSLAQRLLQGVWDPSSNGPAVQDTTP